MSEWVIEHEPNEPPLFWQCAVCEAPVGKPHAEGCRCTLYEGVDPLEADVIGGSE